MRLVRLTSDYSIGGFDCGDTDLNEFLADEALDAAVSELKNSVK